MQPSSSAVQRESRPFLSCLACRARKVRCDRQQPCRSCQRRGEECVWPRQRRPAWLEGTADGHDVQTGPSSWSSTVAVRTDGQVAAQLEQVQARMAELEGIIAAAGLKTGHTSGPSPSPVSKRIRIDAQPHPAALRTGSDLHHMDTTLPYYRPSPVHELEAQIGSTHQHNHSEAVTAGLGDSTDVQDLDDFDHQIISSKRRVHVSHPHLPDESVPSFAHQQDPGTGENGFMRTHAEHLGARFDRLWNKLPPESTTLSLVSSYFCRVEWIHHVVHRPSFDNWFKALCAEKRHEPSTQNTIVGATTSFHDFHRLALLFSMLCLAVHFDEHATEEEHWRAGRFHQLSCQALEAGDHFDCHSIPAIQTLIIQGLWLNDRGQSDRHHANLAIAIRMANGLGLARQDMRLLHAVHGTEIQMKDLYVDDRRKEISVTLELNRRIYWSLVCQDSYTASSCNFTYLIQASQIRIFVPENLDDEDLLLTPPSSRTKESSNLGLPTTMSYHIAKIPFANLARRHVDLYSNAGGQIAFDDVCELVHQIREEHAALPAYLKHSAHLHHTNDWDGLLAGRQDMREELKRTIAWQALFMDITMHNRIIRLFRPFVIRGYTNVQYAHAKDLALVSAKALLNCLTDGRRNSFPGLRWWVIRIHTFTAGVVCCIALYHRTARPYTSGTYLRHPPNDVERSDLVAYINLAVSLLSEGASFSSAAQHAVDMLRTLYQLALPAGSPSSVSSTPYARRIEQDSSGSSQPDSSTFNEETSSLIPTIDWNAFLGPMGVLGDHAEQVFSEVIDAFGPREERG